MDTSNATGGFRGNPGGLGSIAAAFLVLLCGACTAIVQPHVSSAEFLVPGDKIPATVELYVSDAFRAYTVKKTDISEMKDWQFELGPVAVDAFRFALEAHFRDVDVKLGEPRYPLAAPAGFFAVVTPSFGKFAGSDPILFKFENYTAAVEFQVNVYDAAGKPLFSRQYTGKGKKQGAIGYEDPGHAAYPIAVQNAVKDAVGQFVGDLVAWVQTGEHQASALH